MAPLRRARRQPDRGPARPRRARRLPRLGRPLRRAASARRAPAPAVREPRRARAAASAPSGASSSRRRWRCEPDLATVMGGLNDLIAPACDVDAVLAELDTMLAARCVGAGATVLTNTFPTSRRSRRCSPGSGPRSRACNDGIRAVGRPPRRAGRRLRPARGRAPTRASGARTASTPTRVGHALIAAAFADTARPARLRGWPDPLPPRVAPRRRAPRRARGAVGRPARRAVGRPPAARPLVRRRAHRQASRACCPVASLFHLVRAGRWPARGRLPAGVAGAPRGSSTSPSPTRSRARRTGTTRDAAELVAVEVDPMRLDVPIRVEDSYGSGTAFPHAYGPVPVTAATAAPARCGAAPTARWTLSPGGGAAAVASPGR